MVLSHVSRTSAVRTPAVSVCRSAHNPFAARGAFPFVVVEAVGAYGFIEFYHSVSSAVGADSL